MDTGTYDSNTIIKTGILFRKLWFKNEEDDKTLRTLRSYSYYSPISIHYPECFHDKYVIEKGNNSVKTKRKASVDDDHTALVYICDFCKFYSLDDEIMLEHCQKADHMSFSQYKSCRSVNGAERVFLFKPFYYINLSEEYNKTTYFICPFCRILFASKFSCSYHIKTSHKNGYFYSRCSILSKTDIKLYNHFPTCLECKTKSFLTYSDYIAHLSRNNYRCCPIMKCCAESFGGLIYIVCKCCSSYAFEHSDNFPNFNDLFEFISFHPCFTGENGKPVNEIVCMKLSIPNINCMKMNRLHDFQNSNDPGVIIFHLKMCENVFNSVQLSYRHEPDFLLDVIDKSEFLSTLLAASMCPSEFPNTT